MAIKLRKVQSLADVEHNLNVLAQALSNISGEQIAAGAVGDLATNQSYMPRTGGSFGGAINAPSISVNGSPVALSADLASYVQTATLTASYQTTAAADAKYATQALATTAAAGLVKAATALADLNQTISGTYSQSEVQAISDKVDALLAALRTAGVLSA